MSQKLSKVIRANLASKLIIAPATIQGNAVLGMCNQPLQVDSICI